MMSARPLPANPFDLHAAQRDHSEGDGGRQDYPGSCALECLPAERAVDGEAVTVYPAPLIEREAARAKQGVNEVPQFSDPDVSCREFLAQV
jgi:hypothetical protein